ncbi:MAG: VWA domain-containing protein [Candidatus Aminicenantes bacterium]
MAFIKIFLLTFFAVFFLFFSGLYVSPQQAENTPQQKKQEQIPQPAYEVEVVVTNVHVVVTDKDGNRVTGLKPENFKLYEDGLLQKLTNFYEIKGMEVYASSPGKDKKKPSVSPLPQPQRSSRFKNKIIIYFDNWQLHPMSRNWSIKKLDKFIQNNFSPEQDDNQGMVVSLDQKLNIIQEFTSTPYQLLRALDEVKKRSGQSLIRRRHKEDLRRELNQIVADMTREDNRFETYERALGYARHYVEAEQNDLQYSLKSMNAFLDYLAGIAGKKILIYVSDGLPINPGEEVFSFLDQAFPVGHARAEAMNYDATKLFKALTSRCNANEISIYPINAQGLESMILSADKERGWDTYTRGPGMVKSTSRVKNDALKLMAQETGGLAILNTNDIESGLQRIEGDLQFYYSLGYISPHREDNQYHSIRVELVGVEEKYDVRVRREYRRVSQEERIEEGVFSRLYLSRPFNPMNIMAQIMPVEPMPGSEKLKLSIKFLIPIKNLTLYSQQNEYRGQIKVYIALMDTEGRLSPCHELTENITIPSQDYAVAVKSFYPYYAEMYITPGRYTISAAVKDVLGDTINYVQLEKTITDQ